MKSVGASINGGGGEGGGKGKGKGVRGIRGREDGVARGRAILVEGIGGPELHFFLDLPRVSPSLPSVSALAMALERVWL